MKNPFTSLYNRVAYVERAEQEREIYELDRQRTLKERLNKIRNNNTKVFNLNFERKQ